MACMDFVEWRRTTILRAIIEQRLQDHLLVRYLRQFNNDREVILAAIIHEDQEQFCLQYASAELRNDHALVMTAVTKNGLSLKFASESLKQNRDIVLAAIKQNGCAYRYASYDLKLDQELIIRTLARNYVCFHDYVPYHSDCRTVNYLKNYLQQEILFSESFVGVFLSGWLQNNKTRLSTCRLPILRKLGKYVSNDVKRLIADYAGICYGEKLTKYKGALDNRKYLPYLCSAEPPSPTFTTIDSNNTKHNKTYIFHAVLLILCFIIIANYLHICFILLILYLLLRLLVAKTKSAIKRFKAWCCL
jgi:hypothetical protein